MSTAVRMPRASSADSLKVTALVVAPSLLQGLFARRPAMVSVARWLDVDRRGVALLHHLRHRYGEGPLRIRLAGAEALLLLCAGDVQRVLNGSSDHFSADVPAKKRGMTFFQPDALTISRGESWERRRAFTERVLNSDAASSNERIETVCDEEIESLLRDVSTATGELSWQDFHETFGRIARRVVLGDAAADDQALSTLLADLMRQANRMPGHTANRYGDLLTRIERYARDAGPDCPVGRFGASVDDDALKACGQIPHWLFALHDTTAGGTFRALALLATHPRHASRLRRGLTDGGDDPVYPQSCLQEALRLWPPTALLSRQTLVNMDWDGQPVAAGTQILIVNLFHHRDRFAHPFADDFSPQIWPHGRGYGAFNHFSQGPQGCPGQRIALRAGGTALTCLISRARVRYAGPPLRPGLPLPYQLDVRQVRFRLRIQRHRRR